MDSRQPNRSGNWNNHLGEKGGNNGIDGKCNRRGVGERCQSAEMDGCVPKLFRPEELMEQLNASDGLIGHCHKNGVKFA